MSEEREGAPWRGRGRGGEEQGRRQTAFLRCRRCLREARAGAGEMSFYTFFVLLIKKVLSTKIVAFDPRLMSRGFFFFFQLFIHFVGMLRRHVFLATVFYFV